MWIGLLGLAVACSLPVAPAQAQATRTWVSGVGDDVNPCSRTAPCKTFAGAISKTATGGEINVLDPGGFGAVTITKSITISSESSEAGVLVSGTNGIVVSGAGIIVTLRGLDFQGLGTGLAGISFLAGAALHVEKCTIRSFNAGAAAGISFTPSTAAELFVEDTVITENGINAAGTGGGILVAPGSGGSANVELTRVVVNNNTVGVKGTGTSGVVNMTIRDSTIAGSTFSAVSAVSPAAVTILVNRSTISNNAGTALVANGSGAVVNIGASVVSGNGAVFVAASSGVVQSYGDNNIDGNATNTPPPTTGLH
jgi:hypothetical protein